MDIYIKPSKIGGKLKLIASKSMSHRLLIGAALADGKSQIKNVLDSDDIRATKEMLSHLGIRFNRSFVYGSNIQYDGAVLNAKASGSSLRFLIPVAMLQHEKVFFDGADKLPTRPLTAYEKIFNEKKYLFDKLSTNHNLPLAVKGPLQPGIYTLDTSVSSQFITGLLFALPLLDGDSSIVLESKPGSVGYIDLTIEALKKFNIKVKKEKHSYIIKGNQSYQPQTLDVEGDYSQAAFWMVAAVIGAKIKLTGVNHKSKQGDRAIVGILEKMGAKVIRGKDFLTTYPSQTKGITIRLDQIPDLGPILMVLAALSEGTTVFKDIERLKIKESNRIESVYVNLLKMGVDIKVFDDKVVIKGKPILKGDVEIDTFEDHRIAMAFAVASIRADGPVLIKNAAVVSKSYPNFFEDFKKLGGIYEIR